MAIYIQIRKLEENESGVTYAFGPSEGLIGKVMLTKATGQVELIEIDDPRKAGLFVPRVARALAKHHAQGDYPVKTCYAA